MMGHLGIAVALLAATVYNLGFVLEKRALGRMPAIDPRHLRELLHTLFTAPAWLVGFTLIAGGLVLQVVVLSLEPLTVAQPLQASGVVVTIVLSRLVLRERLGAAELACVGAIAGSVVLLSLSNGGGSAGAVGVHADGLAIAAAATPTCLSGLIIYNWTHRAFARRHRFPVTGVGYGLSAGLMYGVAGLALKALSAEVFPGTSRHGSLFVAASSPYLWLLLGCSAIGMCLFQTALQRCPASIVVPVSTVISSGYLVIIGSWLFQERLPADPALLAMRLGGGLIAVTVPIILTVAAERAVARRRPDHVSRGRSGPPRSNERSLS
jgi:drug/metabolite transporter (DMT)-like permease